MNADANSLPEDAGEGCEESADSCGVVAQMLRYTELSARIALGQALDVVEHYKGIVRRQTARIAELEAERDRGRPGASSRRKTPTVPRRRAARRDR